MDLPVKITVVIGPLDPPPGVHNRVTTHDTWNMLNFHLGVLQWYNIGRIKPPFVHTAR